MPSISCMSSALSSWNRSERLLACAGHAVNGELRDTPCTVNKTACLMAEQSVDAQGLKGRNSLSNRGSGTREMYFCDCWFLSPDAQTLSIEHRKDDLAGQLTVLDKAR